MLDRCDACVDAVVQAGTVVGVAGDFDAFEARFVNDGVGFFEAEIGDADDFAVGREAVAIGTVDFDQVGAVVELFADGFACFIGSVDGLHADGDGYLRVSSLRGRSRRWWRCRAWRLSGAGRG